MTIIRLTGKAEHVSREQVRTFLYASVSVLAYHGWHAHPVLSVRLVRAFSSPATYGDCCGSRIRLRQDLSVEDMLWVCLHEVIHACHSFPKETSEKCTSTLTAKLKPDVAKIAAVLLEGTYQRAAFLGHCKLSYRAVGPDHYDDAQAQPLGVRSKYQRKRNPE